MNNFVFKIFGAPYTFDLYRGNGSEIGYFQNFDNGGKENTKLTIHRMASGKVSYSYLRYNFISSSGRPNSFFGMSVVFDNEYCKDIQKIFDLFDAIYNGIILKNGILLTELKGNPTAQAKYLVAKFAEAEGEVKNVENNIINNLKNHFTNDIVPLDNSFLESNSMVKLNDQMGNAAFVGALKKCSWVHISSAYSTNEEPIPNLEFLAALDETIEEVQKQMPTISVRALKGENIQRDVNNYLGKIDASTKKIFAWLEKEYKLQKGANLNPCLEKQHDLRERYDKLLEIQKPLYEMSTAVSQVGGSTYTGGRTTGTGNLTPTGSKTPQIDTDNNDKEVPFLARYKPQLIAATVVLVLVVVGVIFLIPTKVKDTAVIDNTETEVKETATAKTENPVSIEKNDKEIVEDLFNQAATAANKDAAEAEKATENNKNARSVKIKTGSIQLSTENPVANTVFTATITNPNSTTGRWSFTGGNVSINESQRTADAVQITISKSGEYKIYYKIDGEEVASLTIQVM